MLESEPKMEKSFDELFEEALMEKFSGWDFEFIKDRIENKPLPWDYETIIDEYITKSQAMLDMGTGGGELLEKIIQKHLRDKPKKIDATEFWSPNISIAQKRLEKYGVNVIPVTDPNKLRLDNVKTNFYDLVINRHEAFDPQEVSRILLPNKLFITQQVGGLSGNDINHYFNDHSQDNRDWDLEKAVEGLKKVGFEIQKAQSFIGTAKYKDIGALVYYLKAIPWQIPGFKIDEHKERFRELHDQIKRDGFLPVKEERFLIIAKNNKNLK